MHVDSCSRTVGLDRPRGGRPTWLSQPRASQTKQQWPPGGRNALIRQTTIRRADMFFSSVSTRCDGSRRRRRVGQASIPLGDINA